MTHKKQVLIKNRKEDHSDHGGNDTHIEGLLREHNMRLCALECKVEALTKPTALTPQQVKDLGKIGDDIQRVIHSLNEADQP